MKPSELMNIALKAGEIMLSSGAEIYRVEETIVRISSCFHVPCESFVLPTGIFISIQNEDGNSHTAFKRIRDRKVDLNKIERVNNLSRSLQEHKLSYNEIVAELKEIESERQYIFPLRLASAAVSSFVFTVLFHGSWYEGLAALAIGAITYLLREILVRKGLFQFMEVFLAGLVAGFLSTAAALYFPFLNEYKIIIGSVILYLPGISITNGIKDALYGDLVASLTRLGEALLLVAVLVAGVSIAIALV